MCVCVPVYPSACKLRGNISRKKKTAYLFFIAFLWLPRFIFSTTLAFVSLLRRIKNNKRIRCALFCFCCCCCCGFSVFHVKQLIKKLFAPCCTNKRQKRQAKKAKKKKRRPHWVLGHVWHYALPFPAQSMRQSVSSASGSGCVTPSHLASASSPLLPTPRAFVISSACK